MRRNERNIRNRNKIRKKQERENQDKKTISVLSKSVIVLLIAFVFVAIFYGIYNYFTNKNFLASLKNETIETSSNTSSEEAKEEEQPTDITFSLAAIGDIMCHNTQYNDAYNSETGEYDFSYVFDDINIYTKVADLCVGNLETTFAGSDRGYSSYPTFNTPDSLAYNLKKIGLDVLATANNHSLDTGFSGLSRTIDILNDADIPHLGTYTSQEQRDTVFIKYIKGIKIAFVNYTYGTNGIPVPSDKPYSVNLIDKDLMAKDIQAAKDQGAEIIIACMHWGTEYQTTPNSEQEELADFLFQNGVNIILGGHPHVLQPMEKRTVTLEDGTTRDGFVIYSLGNFTADQNAKNTRSSIILDLTITKHVDGSVTIDHAEYTPIYMLKDTSKATQKFKILDIEKSMAEYESDPANSSISASTYNTITNELDNIKKIVGEEF